ncbi:MAG TPA: alpha/beta hydrolase [Thermoanaerobaculia bacterium]|nr:alpha/beta hydrolase [Thermoanaerobaculia bacterium]
MRPLWPLLGLALVGAAAAVLASRRHAGDELDEMDEPDEVAPVAGGRRRTAEESERPEPAEPPEPAGAEQLWIAGPAGNLFVRDSGAGAGDRLPVLFVHGLAGNGGQWALQLDHLRRRRRALAVDLRGHGDSDPADDGAYDVAALAADVVAVADHFALRRFVLAGHSMGAAVAIAYAAAHPQRVAGLLLVDPNGDQTRIPRQQIEPFLAALRSDPLAELESYYRQLVVGGDRDAARWVLEDLRLTHEDAVAPAVAAAMEFAPLPALARYPGPKLAVISTANDLPYSLHKLLPGLPVQLVRGTGHWLMMDRPEIFNAVLEAFLEQVEIAMG